MSLFQTFKKGKEIRLAVVGATATGKTYLLTDLVGALKKLGLKRDDKFQQSSLHADIYDLVESKGISILDTREPSSNDTITE